MTAAWAGLQGGSGPSTPRGFPAQIYSGTRGASSFLSLSPLRPSSPFLSVFAWSNSSCFFNPVSPCVLSLPYSLFFLSYSLPYPLSSPSGLTSLPLLSSSIPLLLLSLLTPSISLSFPLLPQFSFHSYFSPISYLSFSSHITSPSLSQPLRHSHCLGRARRPAR